MGCVHTHQGMLTIEGWGNPRHIQSDVQKIREDNRKVGKIGRTISQPPTPGLEHDNLGTMGLKCLVGKHVKNGMMV
jgi:hypothetical protein